MSEDNQRPIGTGDYVRLDGQDWFVEGHITSLLAGSSLGSWCGTIAVRDASPERKKYVGTERKFVWGTGGPNAIRRIPRPAEAQATVPVFPAGADRSKPCPTCSERWGAHYGIACRKADAEKRCSSCGTALTYHYGSLCQGPAQATVPKQGDRIPLEPPAPVLVDGLTPAECSLRWNNNREAIEGRSTAALPMTPAQIACAKQRYRSYESVGWSRLLAHKVAADRDAERNRVRVDLQDID